jgi:hypothetical protein
MWREMASSMKYAWQRRIEENNGGNRIEVTSKAKSLA